MGMPTNDNMKMDALQTQLLDIMRHPGQYEQDKGIINFTITLAITAFHT